MMCPSCGTSNPVGEFICHECGDLLTLPSPNAPPLTFRPVIDLAGGLVAQEGCLLAFRLGNSDYQVPLEEGVTIMIGRDQGEQTLHKGISIIDLGPLNAIEQGVSRDHAAVHFEGSAVYLTDLGSTNGTLLNGRPLLPRQAYVLQSGDRVCFGALDAQVTIQAECPDPQTT